MLFGQLYLLKYARDIRKIRLQEEEKYYKI